MPSILWQFAARCFSYGWQFGYFVSNINATIPFASDLYTFFWLARYNFIPRENCPGLRTNYTKLVTRNLIFRALEAIFPPFERRKWFENTPYHLRSTPKLSSKSLSPNYWPRHGIYPLEHGIIRGWAPLFERLLFKPFIRRVEKKGKNHLLSQRREFLPTYNPNFSSLEVYQ